MEDTSRKKPTRSSKSRWSISSQFKDLLRIAKPARDLGEEQVVTPADSYNAATIPTKKLCSSCKAIKLDFMLSPPPPDLITSDWSQALRTKHRGWITYEGFLAGELGKLDNNVAVSKCDLCQLFFKFRQPKENDEYQLRGYSAFRLLRDIQFNSIPRELETQDFVVLAVVPKSMPTFDDWSIERHGWQGGYLCRAEPSVHAYSFSGRVVRPLIEYDLLKTWMGFCQRNHTRCREVYGKSTNPLSIKVICCRSLRVIPKPEYARYAALSYVWGNQLEHGDNQPGSILRVDGKIVPRVVQDAISVVQNLDLEYLWVDQLCIEQDEDKATERKEQIQNMHHVYNGAEVTIIAAAGEGSWVGIPGVGKFTRMQPRVNVDGLVVASTLPHVTHSISNSAWATRGWTYQEAVLSRRRIVFTREQAYFECYTMQCAESMQVPLHVIHSADSSEVRPFFRGGQFGGAFEVEPFGFFRPGDNSFLDSETAYGIPQKPWETFHRLWNHIGSYSERSLTFSSDTLFAFTGILQDCKNADPMVGHIAGMPFLYTDTVGRNGIPIARSSFVVSLLWDDDPLLPASEKRRQKGFPSWSWTGWKRVRHSQSKRDRPKWEYNWFAPIHVRDRKGDILPLDKPSARREVYETCSDLYLDAYSYSLRVEHDKNLSTSLRFEDRTYKLRNPSRLSDQLLRQQLMCAILATSARRNHVLSTFFVVSCGTYFERRAMLRWDQVEPSFLWSPHMEISLHSKKQIVLR